MYWLKQGDTSGTAGFESWRRSVLLMVAFVTLVPALCRSFTRSPRVVLGFLLTVLVVILTPWGEILHGAPDRGRFSVGDFQYWDFQYVFHFLILSSHQAAYLLQIQSSQPGAGLQFCDSSLVLAIVSLECDCLRLWTGVFYTDNEFKKMPLIQVTSGGQRNLLKKKLQVCEPAILLVCIDQILIFHQ